MFSDPRESFKGIHGIRDMALMLSLANAYLCEGVFLKKIGLIIDNHLKEIKNDISSLKKQFPGKFVKEVDTDEVLEEIHVTAHRLQEPDKEIAKKCSVGELGLELEASLDALLDTVDAIRMQVEGEVEGYTKAESILRHLVWIKSVGHKIVALSTLIFKLFGLVLLAAAMLSTYLFVTMESEEDLLKRVEQSRSYIQEQMEVLSRSKVEKEQISKEVDAMSEGELSRQDKVKRMDLNVKIHKLDEKATAAEVAIDMHERKIKEMEKKIAELREKSFLQRFLRQ